jgi:hypothetical protein
MTVRPALVRRAGRAACREDALPYGSAGTETVARAAGPRRAVRPAAGDWLSGRAPRSHRGGHWFDPSIAHPRPAPPQPPHPPRPARRPVPIRGWPFCWPYGYAWGHEALRPDHAGAAAVAVGPHPALRTGGYAGPSSTGPGILPLQGDAVKHAFPRAGQLSHRSQARTNTPSYFHCYWTCSGYGRQEPPRTPPCEKTATRRQARLGAKYTLSVFTAQTRSGISMTYCL